MEEIQKRLDKLEKKHISTTKQLETKLETIVNTLEIMSQKTEEEQNEDFFKKLEETKNEIKKETKQILNTHKEYHIGLANFSKTLDKESKIDLEPLVVQKTPFDKKILKQIIAEHLYRDGKFEIGDSFIKETETETEISKNFREQFVEMFEILSDLQQHKIDSTLNWIKKNQEKLDSKGSSLEFDLHSLYYIDLLKQKKIPEAINYSKIKLSKFSKSKFNEIKKLFGCLVFLKNIESSEYNYLFDESSWDVIQHNFTKEYCENLGLSQESNLYLAITAGIQTLQSLIPIANSQNNALNNLKAEHSNELQIEIDFG
ncbi:hypothetical protein M0811_14270 [Anaeramoeba ignava]|uniref:CTLH domain-containing protein n=1 Tax=Anaeramoeba ignava TaxID=1746090 RepID=A0A9Q0RGE2_ANAIG|nr:hypothetical protein M0811_14270 [Anaeramoeba ignava]